MKFRKKPVVIEAIQLLPSNIQEVHKFIYGQDTHNLRPNTSDEERWLDYEAIVKRDGLRLKTMESDDETQKAKVTDWIIKGVQGEFYPCDAEVFEKTYEPA